MVPFCNLFMERPSYILLWSLRYIITHKMTVVMTIMTMMMFTVVVVVHGGELCYIMIKIKKPYGYIMLMKQLPA